MSTIPLRLVGYIARAPTHAALLIRTLVLAVSTHIPSVFVLIATGDVRGFIQQLPLKIMLGILVVCVGMLTYLHRSSDQELGGIGEVVGTIGSMEFYRNLLILLLGLMDEHVAAWARLLSIRLWRGTDIVAVSPVLMAMVFIVMPVLFLLKIPKIGEFSRRERPFARGAKLLSWLMLVVALGHAALVGLILLLER